MTIIGVPFHILVPVIYAVCLYDHIKHFTKQKLNLGFAIKWGLATTCCKKFSLFDIVP